MTERSKGLIPLDFDGVLNTGSTEAYEDIIHRSLVGAGIDIDPDEEKAEILKQWGTPPEKILVSFIKDNLKALKKALQLYRNLYRTEFPEMISPVEGSVDALSELSQHYLLALNTAANK